jgi:hypothetical protein
VAGRPRLRGRGRRELIDPELRRRYREQCIRIGSAKERAELVVDDLARVPPGRRSLAHPVLDGEELGTYRVDWRGKYLLYDKEKLYNRRAQLCWTCLRCCSSGWRRR